MAEYNSLYIKIKINEEKLQQFFHAEPLQQFVDKNLLEWWQTRVMYNKQPLDHMLYYKFHNNRVVFEDLLKGKHFGTVEHYNKIDETWTFLSVFFSENYTEIVPMLSSLKELASYQDPEDTGRAFIYDFYWGCNQVMAYLDFTSQQAEIKKYNSPTEIDAAILLEANQALEEVIERLDKELED